MTRTKRNARAGAPFALIIVIVSVTVAINLHVLWSELADAREDASEERRAAAIERAEAAQERVEAREDRQEWGKLMLEALREIRDLHNGTTPTQSVEADP